MLLHLVVRGGILSVVGHRAPSRSHDLVLTPLPSSARTDPATRGLADLEYAGFTRGKGQDGALPGVLTLEQRDLAGDELVTRARQI